MYFTYLSVLILYVLKKARYLCEIGQDRNPVYLGAGAMCLVIAVSIYAVLHHACETRMDKSIQQPRKLCVDRLPFMKFIDSLAIPYMAEM